MFEPIVNSFGDLFDFLGLFEGGDGEDIAVVLLQIELELIGQLGELASVLERFLVFGFENFVALEASVGKAYFVGRLWGYLASRRELLRRKCKSDGKNGHSPKMHGFYSSYRLCAVI